MSKSKVECFIFEFLDKNIFCLKRLRFFFYFVCSIDLMVSSSYILTSLPINTLIITSYSSLHRLIRLDGFQLIRFSFYKKVNFQMATVFYNTNSF